MVLDQPDLPVTSITKQCTLQLEVYWIRDLLSQHRRGGYYSLKADPGSCFDSRKASEHTTFLANRELARRELSVHRQASTTTQPGRGMKVCEFCLAYLQIWKNVLGKTCMQTADPLARSSFLQSDQPHLDFAVFVKCRF